MIWYKLLIQWYRSFQKDKELHTQWITKPSLVSFSNKDRKYRNMFFRRNILLVLEIPSAYIVRFDEKTQFISFFLEAATKRRLGNNVVFNWIFLHKAHSYRWYSCHTTFFVKNMKIAVLDHFYWITFHNNYITLWLDCL